MKYPDYPKTAAELLALPETPIGPLLSQPSVNEDLDQYAMPDVWIKCMECEMPTIRKPEPGLLWQGPLRDGMVMQVDDLPTNTAHFAVLIGEDWMRVVQPLNGRLTP